MTEQAKFVRWVNKFAPRRGLICHFYLRENAKPYYGKIDFAYFNLFCPSDQWVVRGTTNHGISSARGKGSQVPCLNCFEVNDNFCSVINKYQHNRNDRFEIGIIFNKRKLKRDFEVVDVSKTLPHPLPPPNRCHCFDNPNPQFRRVLYPFHFCDVVRIEIPEIHQLLPIGLIRSDSISGFLVKPESEPEITNLIKSKFHEMPEIFTVL